MSSHWQIKWALSFVTPDAQNKKHHRIAGFLPPKEHIFSLLLGIAKSHFVEDRLEETLLTLKNFQ